MILERGTSVPLFLSSFRTVDGYIDKYIKKRVDCDSIQQIYGGKPGGWTTQDV